MRALACALAVTWTSLTVEHSDASPISNEVRESEAAPIEVVSSRSDLKFELQDPKTLETLFECTGACRPWLVPGKYRVFVGATSDTRAGARMVDLFGASRVEITPRSRAQAGVGLTMGIAGPVLLLVGSALFLSNVSVDSEEHTGSANVRIAGLGTMLTGALLTPIGWVLFGKSRRPAVVVSPASRE